MARNPETNVDRRNEILDIAKAMMVSDGVNQTTMLKIAKAAGASKETLYSWWGNKTGLIEALCLREADQINARLRAALEDDSQPIDETLVTLSEGLLLTLLGEWSLSLNRAAMNSPEVADAVLRSGRFTVGPIVAEYLERKSADGSLWVESGDAGFQMLFGLIMQDLQIRALLGNRAIEPDHYHAHSRMAVKRFLQLSAK